jgi:hypothetical protein
MEHRRYLSEDLAELARQAQAQRGSLATEQFIRERVLARAVPDDWEPRREFLRTLGQNLDRDRIEVIGIAEAPAGFRVLGARRGDYLDVFYTRADLEEQSRALRAQRRAS